MAYGNQNMNAFEKAQAQDDLLPRSLFRPWGVSFALESNRALMQLHAYRNRLRMVQKLKYPEIVERFVQRGICADEADAETLFMEIELLIEMIADPRNKYLAHLKEMKDL